MLIEVFGNWINPKNINYLEDYNFEGKEVTGIHFVGGDTMELIKPVQEVVAKIQEGIKNG